MEGRYYERRDEANVSCRLCPQNCLIHPGKAGVCYARYNAGGTLVPLTYGRVSSVCLDPIEKKPLHFFHPGSRILSVGSVGCNLGCAFCQNWRIAHPRDLANEGEVGGATEVPEVVERLTEPLSVSDLVSLAEKYRGLGSIGVAFTYNEPFIWFEYVLEAAEALGARGLKTVLVTNGYVSEEPLAEILPLIDAMNIDVKGFTETFYRSLGGRLAPVLRTAEKAGAVCHVEITTLLIPGLNTDPDEIKALVDWVADKLGTDTPLHFSRYFPSRRLKVPATSLADLALAEKIARKRLKTVVLGNI